VRPFCRDGRAPGQFRAPDVRVPKSRTECDEHLTGTSHASIQSGREIRRLRHRAIRDASGTALRRGRHPSHRRSRTSRRRLGGERSTTHSAQAEASGVLLTAARADDHVEETTAWTSSASAGSQPIHLQAAMGDRTGKKFTEPVALLSTRPTDRPLPRRAFRLSFDLLALRARCVDEPRASSPSGQARCRSDSRSLRRSSRVGLAIEAPWGASHVPHGRLRPAADDLFGCVCHREQLAHSVRSPPPGHSQGGHDAGAEHAGHHDERDRVAVL